MAVNSPKAQGGCEGKEEACRQRGVPKEEGVRADVVLGSWWLDPAHHREDRSGSGHPTICPPDRLGLSPPDLVTNTHLPSCVFVPTCTHPHLCVTQHPLCEYKCTHAFPNPTL